MCNRKLFFIILSPNAATVYYTYLIYVCRRPIVENYAENPILIYARLSSISYRLSLSLLSS